MRGLKSREGGRSTRPPGVSALGFLPVPQALLPNKYHILHIKYRKDAPCPHGMQTHSPGGHPTLAQVSSLRSHLRVGVLTQTASSHQPASWWWQFPRVWAPAGPQLLVPPPRFSLLLCRHTPGQSESAPVTGQGQLQNRQEKS